MTDEERAMAEWARLVALAKDGWQKERNKPLTAWALEAPYDPPERPPDIIDAYECREYEDRTEERRLTITRRLPE